MPEEQEREPSDAEVADLVRAIEAGKDGIEVPKQLVDEPETPAAAPPRSLYAEILRMPIGQKIKLALRGNHDARMILIRDTNKLIRRFVLLNPRIGDNEIISLVRNKTADDELIRMIVDRREWMRLYQVRLGLATNPKTALPVAIRQVATLDDRDLRHIAKSKNVPQAIAAHARRLLLTSRAPK
ncbi:MAG TPA: hypothetical protein VKA21_04115 [Candidatus Binatia bacterium]|nr:hypothetical protein [Candidatus Binatia bacterium]